MMTDRHRLMRLASATLALAVALAPASGQGQEVATRVAGPNRYDTMAVISAREHDQSDWAIVATGENFRLFRTMYG